MAETLPTKPIERMTVERESYRMTVWFEIEATGNGLPDALQCVGRSRKAIEGAIR